MAKIATATNRGLNQSLWGGLQVDRRHYFSADYLDQARFLSLHAQLHACLEVGDAESILDVGIGPGLLEALLKHFQYRVYSFDLASDLKPTVIGRLPRLPFASNSIDIVCAFEVLEHIPFEFLGDCLNAMRRIAKRRVLISVPSQAELDLGKLGVTLTVRKRKLNVDLWRKKYRRLTNPEEHFWELEYGGVTASTINDVAQDQGLRPVFDHLVRPWFHMFVFDTCKD